MRVSYNYWVPLRIGRRAREGIEISVLSPSYAIAKLLSHEQVYAYQFEGKRYDCGTKLGYLEATVAYALKHPELAEGFKKTLAEIL